jgi:hypothetical protein
MFVTTPASAPFLVCPDPLFEFWPEPEEVEFESEELVFDAE